MCLYRFKIKDLCSKIMTNKSPWLIARMEFKQPKD